MPGPACQLPPLLPHDPPLGVSERLWWMFPYFKGVYNKQNSSYIPAWLISVAIRIL